MMTTKVAVSALSLLGIRFTDHTKRASRSYSVFILYFIGVFYVIDYAQFRSFSIILPVIFSSDARIQASSERYYSP